ncbi:NUDIX hydrolase domain-like protein [Lipomyces mesembrius]
MLSQLSLDCLHRLRQYAPPPTSWHSVSLSRRAAVLILLHPNSRGGLSVVLTMRGPALSSFSSQAALPGGKADSESESEFTIARREAYEEIGLPLSLDPEKYVLEEIVTLPAHLARNWLVVRPSVAYLSHLNASDGPIKVNDVLELDQFTTNEEVSAVFTVPFERFLQVGEGWYKGSWMDWGGLRWRQHVFSVKATDNDIIPNNIGIKGQPVYKVWGLTARMLLDAARIAYAREPEMEYSPKPGDELLISKMIEIGKLGATRDKSELSVRFSDLFDKELLAQL